MLEVQTFQIEGVESNPLKAFENILFKFGGTDLSGSAKLQVSFS